MKASGSMELLLCPTTTEVDPLRRLEAELLPAEIERTPDLNEHSFENRPHHYCNPSERDSFLCSVTALKFRDDPILRLELFRSLELELDSFFPFYNNGSEAFRDGIAAAGNVSRKNEFSITNEQKGDFLTADIEDGDSGVSFYIIYISNDV